MPAHRGRQEQLRSIFRAGRALCAPLLHPFRSGAQEAGPEIFKEYGPCPLRVAGQVVN